ncbi:MAG: FHA domain-containing protein [Arenicella sp.]|nr:FHA domain-containing protein [Arenicella sp.]
MRNLIVEIIGKEGLRIERVKLNTNGLSIGRAWNSDIIIQDRFVDADHLRFSVNQEQQILIDDVSSTNGSRLAGKALNGNSQLYRFGDILSIGDTRIKVFDADTAVAPAALRSKWFLLAERFSRIRALFILTVFAVLTQAAQEYSSSIEPVKLENLVLAAFSVVLLLLIWSLVLGFVAKLIRGESNIKALWALGSLATVVLNLVGLILLFVRFNLQDVSLGETLSILLFGVFSIWLLAGVFSYTTHIQNRNKWLCSFLIAVSLYAITESDEYLKEPHKKWKSSTDTEQATLPPVFLLRRGVSLDEYQLAADSLFRDPAD